MTENVILIIITPNKTGRIILNKYKKHTGHIEEFTGKELTKIVNDYGFKVINNNRGIIEIKKAGDKHDVIPRITNDIDLTYVLFFICRKIGTEK